MNEQMTIIMNDGKRVSLVNTPLYSIDKVYEGVQVEINLVPKLNSGKVKEKSLPSNYPFSKLRVRIGII